MSIRLLLSIDSVSLGIKKIPNASFPRATIEPLPKIEYSINGAVIGDGPNFAPKHLWTISAFLTAEERDVLQAIYAEFDYLRRTLQPAEIDLSDYTLPFVERPPRTRSLAPGALEASLGSQVKYFATFKTWMIEPPKFEVQGRLNLVSFTLQEAE